MTTQVKVAASCVVAIVLAACSVPVPVAVERSDRSVGELQPDSDRGLPDVEAERPPARDDIDLPVVNTPTTALSWGNCERFDIPDVEDLGTARWE